MVKLGARWLVSAISLSTVLVLFSGVSFLVYGLSCLFSSSMVSEFVRFGVPEFRRLTGALEEAAAAGLGLGLIAPVLGVIASGG